MTLTLSITNVERLENGVPTKLRLDRHGAVIGRSATADWSLPDPQHYISAVHCEVDFRDGVYTLVDKSTNGTFVNGGQARMAGPHTIAEGDVILIGHYQVAARLEGAPAAPPPPPAWEGWRKSADTDSAPPPIEEDKWGRGPRPSEMAGGGGLSRNYIPPQVTPSPPPTSDWGGAPAASAWATPPPPSTPASGWSSRVDESGGAAPSASDVWGELAAGNVVDWARGGFGETPRETPDPLGLGSAGGRPQPDPLGLGSGGPRLQPDPLGLGGPTPPPSPEVADAAPGWGPQPTAAPLAQTSAPVAPAPAPAPIAARGAGGAELAAFLAGAGLAPNDLKTGGAEAMTAAGQAMRRIVAGLVVMLEARARAKAQLGAQGTALEFDGNNPLKFARAPEKAVAQLLNPPERGFMSAERAIEDSFRDLQAHQMATLSAMQGALAATLARFSPDAIRGRAESGGLMAKILPHAREAALWQAYEREFEGVARGSDEAFMDVFAKEFRAAYERVSADMKRKG